MGLNWNWREHRTLARFVLKWVLLAVPPALLAGSASAFFLWALDVVTRTRWAHPELIWLLPLAGVPIVLIYGRYGKGSEGGNDLLMEHIHEPGAGVPTRLAPLVLGGTLVTHLFGGSAGREGTAIQMAGGLAAGTARALRLSEADTQLLLMCGVAAGFGSVFGTPLTGAVFALEVLTIGRVSYEALIPCLVASVIGDWTCHAWGIHHLDYHRAISGAESLDLLLVVKAAMAGSVFGLTSVLFAELSHALKDGFGRVSRPWLRPVLGGLAVILISRLLGTTDYLGLGVTAPPSNPGAVTILSCFHDGGAGMMSWWWKLLLTALTLSCGFKGGEVTPLFFIGAALGNTLARPLGLPVDLAAGLGFVAVFAGATNTPLACTIMGIELFGAAHTVPLAAACFFAYYFSGHTGIYSSQRVGTPKTGRPDVLAGQALRELRPARRRRDNDGAMTGGAIMSTKPHDIHAREMGQLRIYIPSGERRKPKGLRERLFNPPLYREIIHAAKKDGILNATAHGVQYGYSGAGQPLAPHPEHGNAKLVLCVELIAHRGELETFCRQHAEILKGRVIVYKHLEHWDLRQDDVVVHDATKKELKEGA
ncbi:MAG: voltage-gated chloride channel family protein [Elusimicrobia bacterium]|nr:voltage-gated chloride channel family protein [Elusimicrobiota bacterium]